MNYGYKPYSSSGYPSGMGNYFTGPKAGPYTIVVRQVVGENQIQKILEVPVAIPPQHPPIEQIVDVLVRRLRVTRVEVLFNKVIVCGDLEVKALYVASLPNQPVHAIEVSPVRFAADVPVNGAYWGMDGEALAKVEYVNYDCAPYTRPYWYKQHQYGYGYGTSYPPPGPGVGASGWGPAGQMNCNRFHVTVVLNIGAKVMTDREVTIYPGPYPGLPPSPQG